MIVFTANWGRGVDAARFRNDAARVLDLPGHREDASIYGIQELDEADAPDEHGIVSQLVAPGTTKVGWGTLEPILVGSRYKVRREVVTPACHGLAHWSPNRTWVQALIEDPQRPHVPPVVVMNAHSPRRSHLPDVQTIVHDFDATLRGRVAHWLVRGFSVIWTGDMNESTYPRAHTREKTAVHSGLDYIRYVAHPAGAQIEVASTGTVPLDIDNHDAHWARLILTTPKEKS